MLFETFLCTQLDVLCFSEIFEEMGTFAFKKLFLFYFFFNLKCQVVPAEGRVGPGCIATW